MIWCVERRTEVIVEAFGVVTCCLLLFGVQAVDAYSVNNTAARLNLPAPSTSYSKEVSNLMISWHAPGTALPKWKVLASIFVQLVFS